MQHYYAHMYYSLFMQTQHNVQFEMCQIIFVFLFFKSCHFLWIIVSSHSSPSSSIFFQLYMKPVTSVSSWRSLFHVFFSFSLPVCLLGAVMGKSKLRFDLTLNLGQLSLAIPLWRNILSLHSKNCPILILVIPVLIFVFVSLSLVTSCGL